MWELHKIYGSGEKPEEAQENAYFNLRDILNDVDEDNRSPIKPVDVLKVIETFNGIEHGLYKYRMLLLAWRTALG